MKAASPHHSIPASHFSAKTLRALTKKGIRIISMEAMPDEKGSYLNSQTGYVIDDNGTGKMFSFLQILTLAAAGTYPARKQ